MEEERKDIKPVKKKKGIIRRLLIIILYIILFIIGINVLLYVLLSIPFVQQTAKDIAVKELKTMLKTEISIERLDLKLFNNVALKGVYIEDLNKDTLLYANNINASIDVWKLLKNDLQITGVGLDDFVININRKDSISDFNFQFIIDTFGSNDTTKIDTTQSSLKIAINNINIRKGRLNYDVISAPKTPNIFNVNHISVIDFNADVDLNSIDTDNLDIYLDNLSAKETTGLTIDQLKGKLISNKSELSLIETSLKLPNSHLILGTTKYNLDTDDFEINTEDTEIDPIDFLSILPEIKYLKNKIYLNTQISGKLPSVNVEDIRLSYGEDLKIEGKAEMSDVNRYGKAKIGVSIDKFKVSPKAIETFAKVGDSTFIMPDILNTIGDIHLKANLNGYLSNFKLKGELWTKQGAIDILAKGSTDTTFTRFKINSNLHTNGINLSKIVGEDTGLGRVALEANVIAEQNTATDLSAKLKGKVNLIEYQGENIKRINFGGFYNAKEMGASVDADWSIGKIMALAKMSQEKDPDIDIDIDINSLQTNYFFKNEKWKNPILNLKLDGKIKGTDINNLVGNLNIKNFCFRDSLFDIDPGPMSLDIKRSDNQKMIQISSSFLSVKLDGEYQLTTLGDEISNMMSIPLPNIFEKTKVENAGKNKFKFSLLSKNLDEIFKMLDLPIVLNEPIQIDGNINTETNQIVVEGKAPSVYYNDININSTSLSINNKDSIINIKLGTQAIMDEDIYNLSFTSDIADNKIHSFINVNNDSSSVDIKGSIEAITSFIKNDKNDLITFLQVIPSNVHVGNLDLYLMPARIININDKTEIHNLGIALNKKKCFGIDGILSNNEQDSLKVSFDNAQVYDLLEPFNIKSLKAEIDGDIVITNILDKPIVYTNNFQIADISLFGDTLGTLSCESKWNNALGGMRLKASLAHGKQTYASVNGIIHNKMETIDMSINTDKMPIKWAHPFVADMLNKLDGSLSSNIKISGKTSKPDIEGWIGANNIIAGLDMTNVVYKINDTIQIDKNKIGFDKLLVTDQYDNKANVNAEITHKDFSDIKYSIGVNMTNLMVLNTLSRTDSLYYGKVFVSGTANIYGDEKGATINMKVRNNKNSKLNISIPQTSEAIEYKSVVFINVPEDKLKAEAEQNNTPTYESSLPIKLNIGLDVNPDIEIGVIIDPATGDAMKVKGTGHIDFTCDLQTMDMKAYGDYIISDGSAKFNLQQISNLEFKIKEGSELKFVGDPMKTKFNITAYRRVKADLNTLSSNFGETDGSSKQTVDCLLEINGNIDNIQLSYNIDLPDATDDIRSKVNSLISTEEQKTLQFAYLILSGSFHSSSGDGSNIGTGMVTSFATGKISNGLDAVFGKLLGNKFEVGTNIESNDGSFTNMDMSVNVSTKLFDDKLRLKTNLGYKTDQTATNDNPFIGDFDVEYILTPNWTLKAYNHSNNDYYRTSNTTQGIGISYTKEAKRIKQLFNFLGKRRRRKQTTPSQNEPSAKQPIINDKKNK